MPSANPLVMVRPQRARYSANWRAVSRPERVGLRLPTIASWGVDRAWMEPCTYNASGAAPLMTSIRGYWDDLSDKKCLSGPSLSHLTSAEAGDSSMAGWLSVTSGITH